MRQGYEQQLKKRPISIPSITSYHPTTIDLSKSERNGNKILLSNL